MKNIVFVLILLFLTKVNSAQEANMLNAEPDALMKFLEFPYKKIEVEIIQYTGNGTTKYKTKGKSAFKIIEYNNPGTTVVINKSKDDKSDTLTYKYDRCGGLEVKKGSGTYCEYGNRYKNCTMASKRANETEVFSGGFNHVLNLIRYTYNKEGQLTKEMIYDFEDSSTAKYCIEYAYKGAVKDSIREFYYDEDGKKLLNRKSRYFYTNKQLDSILNYNAENTVIEKVEYTYHPDGKLKSIRTAYEYAEYFYYSNQLEKITEQGGMKEYVFKFSN